MRVGFTGSRRGMTQPQKMSFYNLLIGLTVTEFHHGDCIGSDDEAADMASVAQGDCIIVCHPPLDESHRAFNKRHHQILKAKTHFVRNRDIVDETDILIATPCDTTEQSRGGTWYTVSYARKRRKQIKFIWPSGIVTGEQTLAST